MKGGRDNVSKGLSELSTELLALHQSGEDRCVVIEGIEGVWYNVADVYTVTYKGKNWIVIPAEPIPMEDQT